LLRLLHSRIFFLLEHYLDYSSSSPLDIILVIFILNRPICQRNKFRNPNPKLAIVTFRKVSPSSRPIRPSPPLKPPESCLARSVDRYRDNAKFTAKLIDLFNTSRPLVHNN